VFHQFAALKCFCDEEGQDLVEYALLLALIVVASSAFLIAMGGDVDVLWSKVASQLASVT
jgi:Flp pilus assembly pilin Flp